VDIDALLRVIDSAFEFVYVAVMDYFPGTLYQKSFTFWPLIDDALRKGNKKIWQLFSSTFTDKKAHFLITNF